MMETFKPKYKKMLIFAFVIITILCVLYPIMFIKDGDLSIENIVIWLILLVIDFLAPYIFIKEIDFKDKIYLKRYIYPGFEFNYIDIKSIGLSLIKLDKKKGISIREIQNKDVLFEMISRNSKFYTGNAIELNEEVIIEELKVNNTLAQSVLIAFIVNIFAIFLGVIPDSWNIRVFSLIVTLVFFMGIFIIKRSIEKRTKLKNK